MKLRVQSICSLLKKKSFFFRILVHHSRARTLYGMRAPGCASLGCARSWAHAPLGVRAPWCTWPWARVALCTRLVSAALDACVTLGACEGPWCWPTPSSICMGGGSKGRRFVLPVCLSTCPMLGTRGPRHMHDPRRAQPLTCTRIRGAGTAPSLACVRHPARA